MILTKTEAMNRAKQGDVKAMEALVQYFASRGDYAQARKWRAKANAYAQRAQNPVRRQKKSHDWVIGLVLALGFVLVYGVFGQMDSARSSSGTARSASSAPSSEAYAWSGESEPQSVSAAPRRTTDDPFEGIFYAQSRDEVLRLLGEPDSTRRPTRGSQNRDVYDTYNLVSCAGYSGTLRVYYDGYEDYREMTVREACFYVSATTDEEHSAVRGILEDFSRFYTSRLGEPEYSNGEKTLWHRGNAYTSEVDELILLVLDAYSNYDQAIQIWLFH